MGGGGEIMAGRGWWGRNYGCSLGGRRWWCQNYGWSWVDVGGGGPNIAGCGWSWMVVGGLGWSHNLVMLVYDHFF